MQEFEASLKDYKVSARKARLVVNLVRGKPVQTALDILALTKKKSAPVLSTLIRSAISNAQQTATIDVDKLVVSTAYVDEGATLNRWLPRAQGRATPIRKRSSHITIKLKELN